MVNRKVSQSEIDGRRIIIRILMAKGIRKPGDLLKHPRLVAHFEGYKNPYATIRKDIDQVKKENRKAVEIAQIEEIGEYVAALENQLTECWMRLPHLKGTAVVRMMRCIGEITKDIARARGIDPYNIDPKILQLNKEIDQEVKQETINRDTFALPDDIGLLADVANIQKRHKIGLEQSKIKENKGTMDI